MPEAVSSHALDFRMTSSESGFVRYIEAILRRETEPDTSA